MKGGEEGIRENSERTISALKDLPREILEDFRKSSNDQGDKRTFRLRHQMDQSVIAQTLAEVSIE